MLKDTVFGFIVVMSVFCILSMLIFDNIYKTTGAVVDEEFHLPLGLAYCRYKFSLWDSKVTTLPGLYLVSTLFLAPFDACTTYWLRFVSLGAAILNIPLLFILFHKKNQTEGNNLLSSATLALLPPVYFFSHFYYTDIVSLTAILLMFVCYEYRCHYVGSIIGLVAVLCRQTNIIWVLYLLGKYALDEMYQMITPRYHGDGPRGIPLQEFKKLYAILIISPKILLKYTPLQYVLDVTCYGSIVCTFLLFVMMNGGIVVGDKTAHEASIHIPQLFYFSLFCLAFAWPHFVGELLNFLEYVKNHKIIFFTFFVFCTLAVHLNTIVHPYMLADNRHYTFYIWNRFYGKYLSFRYTIVPMYMFAWYVICKTMFDKKDITTVFIYVATVICLLVPQKLIDVRYYFAPYIIFRLHVKSNQYTAFNLILELVTYIVINVITFNLFFTKQIHWADYDEPQRLIW